MANGRYYPTDIIQVLSSIKKLSVDDGELKAEFENGNIMVKQEFVRGSFTRELLELIEEYMRDE